jgi:hypothetical protein
MTGERRIYAFAFTLLGLIYGYVVCALAIGFTGGGHGWNSAIISAVVAVFIPAFGVALGSPREHRWSALLMIAAAMGFADAFLVFSTRSEGVSYFWKVWSSTPGGIVLWAVLWIAWQLAVVVVLVHDVVAARRDKRSPRCKKVDGYAVGESVDI